MTKTYKFSSSQRKSRFSKIIRGEVFLLSWILFTATCYLFSTLGSLTSCSSPTSSEKEEIPVSSVSDFDLISFLCHQELIIESQISLPPASLGSPIPIQVIELLQFNLDHTFVRKVSILPHQDKLLASTLFPTDIADLYVESGEWLFLNEDLKTNQQAGPFYFVFKESTITYLRTNQETIVLTKDWNPFTLWIWGSIPIHDSLSTNTDTDTNTDINTDINTIIELRGKDWLSLYSFHPIGYYQEQMSTASVP